MDPLLNLCVRAQSWYTQQSLPTKVKACATVGVDELLRLAGVDALTIVPSDLRELQLTSRLGTEIHDLSLFQTVSHVKEKMEYPSYMNDERRYRIDFDHVEDGKAQFKLCQVRVISLSTNAPKLPAEHI